MNVIALALGSVTLSVAAQFALKEGMSHPSVQALLGQPLSLPTVQAVASNLYIVG